MKKLIPVLNACFIALVIVCPISPSHAQQSVKVQHTENPRAYVTELLESMASEGTAPLRSFLKDFGYSDLQTDQTLAMMETYFKNDAASTIKIIEEIDNADVLRQVYAYSHMGGNAWFFWRLDFVKTSSGWALSNFAFNSEYTQVIAPRFKTNTVIE